MIFEDSTYFLFELNLDIDTCFFVNQIYIIITTEAV